MGAFFNNIQIKSSSKDLNTLKEYIIKTITLLNTQNDYVLIDSEEAADKSVIIASNDTPWISVYDDETIMNIDLLNSLGAELSKEEETIAITVLVSDSDYIDLRYNENGVFVDSLSNTADLFNLKTSEAEIWAELISKPFKEIESLWSNKSVFVESFLEEFGKLVNISSTHLLASYDDINEQNEITKTILHFGKKKKEEDLTLEPICLNRLVREGTTKCNVNEPLKLKWMITNFGEPSTGIEIMLVGDALEDSTIIPLTAKISHYKKEEVCHYFIETEATTEEKLCYIKIDDFLIPQGKRPSNSNIKKWQKETAILYTKSISIEIEFKTLKICRTDLKLFIVPLANRQEGCYYELLDFQIK